MGLEKLFYLIGFSQCLLVTLALVRVNHRPQLRIFMPLVALVTTRLVLEFLIHEPLAPLKGLFLALLMASALWLPLALQQITVRLAQQQPAVLSIAIRPKDVLVPLVGLACLLPLLLTAHWGTDYQNPQQPIAAVDWRWINAGQLACVLLFALQVPLVVKQCWRVLVQVTGKAQPLFAPLSQGSHHLLRVCLLVVTATWVAALLRVAHCSVIGGPSSISLVFSLLEVALLLWALLAALKPLLGTVDVVDSKAAATPSQQKYARSALNAAVTQRIQRKLQIAATDLELITDPQLKLAGLCQALNENSHYVSQVINQSLGMSFFDWLKAARIEQAKRLLLEQPALSVTAILETVGFSAKSTFNSAFRAQVGQTPSEFRTCHKY